MNRLRKIDRSIDIDWVSPINKYAPNKRFIFFLTKVAGMFLLLVEHHTPLLVLYQSIFSINKWFIKIIISITMQDGRLLNKRVQLSSDKILFFILPGVYLPSSSVETGGIGFLINRSAVRVLVLSYMVPKALCKWSDTFLLLCIHSFHTNFLWSLSSLRT